MKIDEVGAFFDNNKFVIDDDNILLNAAYKNNNYKIMEGLSKNNLCLLFFSGNGFYWPNEINIFKQEVIYKDRYEWSRVATEMLDRAGKIILVRDVRKNFYVTGINYEINNIDKLIAFLKEESQGYDVITFGNSAGGYMASIVGIKLHAKAVFNFGGQWNLYKYDSYNRSYFIKKYAEDEVYNKYYDIVQLTKESSVPVFYFYAAKVESDVEQESYIHDLANVYCFSFDSDWHGQGLSMEGYVNLLACSFDQLKKLSDLYNGKLVVAEELSGRISEMAEQKCRYNKRRRFLTPIERLRIYRDVLVQWVRKKTNAGQKLIDMGYKEITIWGKGFMCDLLLHELKNLIKVNYIIESNPVPDTFFDGIPIISVDEMDDDTKMIIVVPFYDIDDISERIRARNRTVHILGLNLLIDEG